MNVSELIQQLADCDPEAIVTVGADHRMIVPARIVKKFRSSDAVIQEYGIEVSDDSQWEYEVAILGELTNGGR